MPLFIERGVQALRDIEEAFVYIADDNLDTALNFLISAEESLELLAENPFMGIERPFADPKLKKMRMWRVKGFEDFLIFYVVESERILLLRVVHAKRDFYLIFGD